MKQLKSMDYEILTELVRNSKISDRKLAKKIGVSQPTITRRRFRLEKMGLLGYTAIPNLEEIGVEIIAFTFAYWKPDMRKTYQQAETEDPEKMIKRHKTFLSAHPNLIFVAGGRGLDSGGGGVFVSLHKDYTDYAKCVKDIEFEWGEYTSKVQSFIVSTKGEQIQRSLTFVHMIGNMNREK